MRAFRSRGIGALVCQAILLATLARIVGAQELRVDVRGSSLALRHYPPAVRNAESGSVILASGDGGWRGFETKMAQTMASWGYDVFGLDTREYLRRFGRHSALSEAQAAEDLGAVAAAVSRTGGAPVKMMGWSAGAALAVLAGTRQENQELLQGVVAVSLPIKGELGWNWTDKFSFLPFVKWRGPFFSCLKYVPKVAPLPLLIIQSSGDRWVPEQDGERLFEIAIRPRRRVLLHAGGHSFPSARTKFFEELRKGLGWIEDRERQ